jgi:hypothetical protein
MWPFSKKSSKPEHPPSGEGHQPVLRAIAPWIERHRRQAWRPVLGAAGDADGSRRVSQFGGAPSLRTGETAPACGECGKPLDLFLQLDGRETPAESPWTGPNVLQLFYCRACDDYAPFSKAHLVRAVPADQLVPDAPGAAAGLARRPILSWETLRDTPHPEEQDGLGLHLVYDFRAKRVTVRCPELGVEIPDLPIDATDADGNELAEAIGTAAQGDKLGGWPAWVQGAEYPSCPRCAAAMRYVFQVESNGGADHMFGDLGCGHVSQCPAHADVLAFTWACH